MLCIGLSHVQQCNIMSSLTDILSMSEFCHCFMYKFQLPVESVYWFCIVIFPSHIIFPLLCRVHLEWNFIVCGLWIMICYEQWSALCVVSYVQWSALGIVRYARLAISRQRFWGQIRFDRATGETTLFCRGKQDDDVLLKSLFGRNLWGMIINPFSRILHGIKVF